MTTAHILQVLALECLQAQEVDGDEPVLRLNGEPIWRLGPHEQMSPLADRRHLYRAINFAEGTRLNARGWERMPNFQPGELTYRFEQAALIELYEADGLTSDDLIGRQPVSVRDAAHGVITVRFVREGARYALTYRVDREPAG